MKFPFDTEFFKLDSNHSEMFLNLPETGMGYQILYNSKSYLDDYPDNPIVTNGQYIIAFENNYNTPSIVDFENIENHFSESDYRELFKELSSDRLKVLANPKYAATKGISKNTHPPYLYKTRHGDEFRRLSAFRKDRRILSDGSVLPETFATTLTDLAVVPSGLAAVARYALPNRLPACYVYQIIPEPGTHVYFGTVTPAYGLCGGGVEVFFPNGCDEGSARLIGTIPEK